MKMFKKITVWLICILILSTSVIPAIGTLAASEYTISITCGDGGSVIPNGDITVAQRTSLTSVISPNNGYVIDEIIVDGIEIAPANEYDFTDVVSNHTMYVTFKQKNKGDMNGDGYLTNEDYIMLIDSILLGNDECLTGDINNDEKTDLIDLALMKKMPFDLICDDYNSSNWSISNTSGNSVVSSDGKSLQFDSTSVSVDSAYYNEKSANNWTDYQVECDFLYDNYDYTQKSSYLALVARRLSSKNQSYEFRLSVDASTTAYIVGEFYKRSGDGYTLLKTFDSDFIQNIVGCKKMLLGKTYNLKMLCKENTFYFFIDNNYLGNYTDNDNPYLSGTVGTKTYRAKGSFSNFKVTNRKNKTYKNIGISGFSDSRVNIRYGNSFNCDDYKMFILDFDGSVMTSLLSDDMITVPQIKKGSNEAVLNAFGIQKNIDIYASSSSVSSITNRLVTNKDKNVTVNNASTYKNLIRDVDKYSVKELEGLSDDAVVGYNNLATKLANLNVPFGEKLVYNKFDEEVNSFSSKFESKKGRQYIKNGNMYISQLSDGISSNCYYFDNTYGELSSVSADIRIKSYDAGAGLILNANENGYFYATVSLNKNSDSINSRNSATLRIFRKDSSGSNRIASNTNVDICRNENFNLQITYNNGIVSAYLNYALVSSSPVQDNCNIFEKGYAGVMSSSGDITVDNFAVFGNKVDEPHSESKPTVTEYFNNFENEEADKRPSGFSEQNGENNWTLIDDGNNKYYGTKNLLSEDDLPLYSDDFNSYGNNASGVANKNAMIAKGWDTPNNTTGNYNNSASFNIPASTRVDLSLSNLNDADLWTDYTVSADITYNDTATGQSYSYISGRVKNKAGYWLRVWAKDGIARSIELQSFSNYTKTSILGTYTFLSNERTPCGTQFNVKLMFAGDTIRCYFDDRMLIEVTDNTYSSGYCGIHSASSSVSSVAFDNFIVNKINEKAPNKTKTYLHLFETNPTVSTKLMYNNIDNEDSVFGLTLRNSPDTSYLKVWYDVNKQKWFASETLCEYDLPIYNYSADDVCNLSENIWYDLSLAVDGKTATVSVSNSEFDFEYSHTFNLQNIAIGKIAFFTENTLFYIDDFSLSLPDGGFVQDGITEYTMYDDKYAATFEIEQLDNENMIAVGYDIVAKSDNLGESFYDVTNDYSYLTDGAYPSLLKLHDGSFLRVNSTFEVYSSNNNMLSWNKICPKIVEYKFGNKITKIFHSNSLTEVKLSEGNYRIFLPIATRLYPNDSSTTSSGHYTEIYYSDDNGVTWNVSHTDTRSILYGSQNNTSSSWCESKIIACDDGTLRMYYSRNTLGVMQYTESHDGGITWSGLYQIPEMQCAASSFSVIKDNSSECETDYYLVWVNDSAISLGSYFSRARLSLAHSTDGKNWEFLCDIERMTPEVFSDNLTMTTPLFQIVDPSICVNDDYVYVSYGRSESSGVSFHNSLRINVCRIEKSKLIARPWDASNIADMSFIKRISFSSMPKQTFSLNEKFSYADGTVLVECLDGSSYEIASSLLRIVSVPDMSLSGQKSVTLYNNNGFSLTYNIEVNSLSFAKSVMPIIVNDANVLKFVPTEKIVKQEIENNIEVTNAENTVTAKEEILNQSPQKEVMPKTDDFEGFDNIKLFDTAPLNLTTLADVDKIKVINNSNAEDNKISKTEAFIYFITVIASVSIAFYLYSFKNKKSEESK